MQQGDLFHDFDPARPLVPIARRAASPRDVGLAAGRKALQAAESAGFDADGARRFIVGWLRRHGPTSGEELVKAAKAHGFDPKRHGRDDRAFGGVFLGAQRAGEIRCVRSDLPREKGHGTSGGRLWEAA